MAAQYPETWVTVLDHWQTLISGGLAVLAALLGVGFVYHQTRAAQAVERDRLKRRHAAARSTLPLVLSSMMEYARRVGAGLRTLYLSNEGDAVGRDAILAWEPPQLPTDATLALSEVIEAASNEVADVISDLLSRLQVQSVRVHEVKHDAVAGTAGQRNIPKLELEEYISDIADVYARCEELFDYAQRKSNTANAKPSGESLRRALFLMGFHEAVFDRVKETVQRRGDRKTASTA